MTLLEFGLSRKGFGHYLLVKNFLQFSLAVVFYWLLGYGFSYGNTDSHFIGKDNFGGYKWLSDSDYSHGSCFSYNVLVGIFVIFVINTALIEKVSYITYVVFPICLMIFIWPVVVAWSWGGGWLYKSMKASMIDYGGSVTIFAFAGGFGLVGAIVSGKRQNRFENPSEFKIVYPEIYVLGAFLTILGIFGLGSVQQEQNGGIAFANL